MSWDSLRNIWIDCECLKSLWQDDDACLLRCDHFALQHLYCIHLSQYIDGRCFTSAFSCHLIPNRPSIDARCINVLELEKFFWLVLVVIEFMKHWNSWWFSCLYLLHYLLPCCHWLACFLNFAESWFYFLLSEVFECTDVYIL